MGLIITHCISPPLTRSKVSSYFSNLRTCFRSKAKCAGDRGTRWWVLIEDVFENITVDDKFFRTYHTAHSLRIQAHLHCVTDTVSHAGIARGSLCNTPLKRRFALYVSFAATFPFQGKTKVVASFLGFGTNNYALRITNSALKKGGPRNAVVGSDRC